MKLDPNKSIFEYRVRPIYQALTVLAIIALVCGIAQLAIMAGWFSPKIYFPYVVTFSFLLFYALGNCLLSFAEDNQTKYWTESIISYVGLSTLGAGLAYLMSGLTIGEAKEYFNKILNTFEKIGYEVCAQVLDSRYYGVSQTRTRVIFIAVREDVAEKVGLNFMTISQVFPEPDSDIIPVKDAMIDLEYDPEEVKYLTDKFTNTAYWKQTGSKMEIDPEKVLTGMDYHPKGHHFNLKRVSQYAPSPTITAMGSADTTAGAFHWSEPRKLTIGELKRIQSLPDDFVLTGKWNQKSERIGRMVPPLLLKAVADSVYEKVIKVYKNG